jgi:hypothetical protein
MSTTMVAARTVLVVFGTVDGSGPEPQDIPDCRSLVLLSVGWPCTDAQRAAVDFATAVAYERGIVFDAFLVPSVHEVVDRLATDDVVRVYGRGRGRRRLDRSLRGAGVTVPSWR